MNFAYPWLLALLLLPAGLIYLSLKRGGKRVFLPLDHHDSAPQKKWSWLLHAARILPKLILACCIIILAGPRRYEQPREERELTNIQFCLDVSGSMTAGFSDDDRYGAAMKAVNSFVNHRDGDAFGLTIFGNNVLHWVPLTSDDSAFQCAPPFLHPSKLPHWFGGTEIGKALQACRKLLASREQGDRMIILISDGYSWDLHDGNDVKIATDLKNENISVFTVHVGGDQIPDEVAIISHLTGGASFSAQDQAGLEEVFKRIDQMKKTKLKRVTPDPVDHYQPYLIAALSLLGLHILCLFGLRYTPW